MSIDTILVALGLVLVIEGLMPFVAPGKWRDMFVQLAQLKDGQIRFIGFGAVSVGLVLLLLTSI